MTNADKFKEIFGLYATELWGKPEKEFLEWLNEDVSETNVVDMISKQAVIEEIEYELEMINSAIDSMTLDFNAREMLRQRKGEAREILNYIQSLPSAQPERKKISEEKMKIVIENYFKDECDVNTSIKSAFEKGFRIGVKKGMAL